MIFEKTVNIFAKNGTLKRFRANETNLQIIQGKISSIVSEKEIEELTSGNVTMYTKLGQVTQTASELKTNFSNFKTEYDTTEKDYTEFKKFTSEHFQTAEKFENTVTDYMKHNDETVKNVESKAEQTAGQFKWLVKSGTSETDFTLTDRTTELLTENLIIKNKDGSQTIISGGKMDVEEVLTQNLVVKNKDGSQTIISGGKMDIDEIFAQDITATGTIRGLGLIGADIVAKRMIATKEFALACNSDADVERVLY